MYSLSKVEQIGHSLENIIEIQNVLNEKEHEKLLLDCKNLKFLSGSNDPDNFWYNRIAGENEIDNETAEILKKIFIIAKKEIELKYNIKVINTKNSYNITVWRPAMSMHAHYDDADYKDYNFAALFYINDNYHGGELNFINLNKTVKPKQNSLLIFPGHQTYTHEVKTIINGHRYTSSLWFSFDEENND
jgi:predicted 2-oxoglutarate/Fe(II)-dependent dioxygenase YbiX